MLPSIIPSSYKKASAKQKVLIKRNMRILGIVFVFIGFITTYLGFHNNDLSFKAGGIVSLVFGAYSYYYHTYIY